MRMNLMKRRSFLKSTVVAGATGIAVSAGILSPNIASAASLAEVNQLMIF